MDIVQIVGLGLVATVLAMILKGTRPDMALLVTIITGLLIFGFVISKIGIVFSLITNLADKAGVEWVYLKTVMKVVGIAYLAGFGAQVCRDAGETAIGQKIELAGKVIIMVLSVPIIVAVVDVVSKLLSY